MVHSSYPLEANDSMRPYRAGGVQEGLSWLRGCLRIRHPQLSQKKSAKACASDSNETWPGGEGSPSPGMGERGVRIRLCGSRSRPIRRARGRGFETHPRLVGTSRIVEGLTPCHRSGAKVRQQGPVGPPLAGAGSSERPERRYYCQIAYEPDATMMSG